MISASHNPMPDNGIKLFSRGGHKLPDAVEAAIERTVAESASPPTTGPPVPVSAGSATCPAPSTTTSPICSRPSTGR